MVSFHREFSRPKRDEVEVDKFCPTHLPFHSDNACSEAEEKTDFGGDGRSRTYDTADMSRML